MLFKASDSSKVHAYLGPLAQILIQTATNLVAWAMILN